MWWMHVSLTAQEGRKSIRRSTHYTLLCPFETQSLTNPGAAWGWRAASLRDTLTHRAEVRGMHGHAQHFT